MNVSIMMHRLGKIVTDNSPVILTAIGVTGALTTAFLTGKATFHVAERIMLEQEEIARELDTGERIDFIKETGLWKDYIPAVLTGTLTVAAIIAANRVGTRRAAAMATAFAISERTLEQYKEKIIEKLGENKERSIRDDIAQDNVTNNPPSNNVVIVTDSGHVLCRDDYSGRYFKSSMDQLRKAQNDITWQILNEGDASLTDFYNMIGLPRTSHSDDMGWNADNKFELMFSSVMAENDQPCISFTFRVVPSRDYYRMH